ncbi:hypothetical protein DL96DRAFT_1589139 [Flagelloscypha sp. PMI_526]|nr:hypothetical protein DL96DRAFT_1589139 [Flagelloscypha sp. PMI_526]
MGGFTQMLNPDKQWTEQAIWVSEATAADHECAFMFLKCWHYFQSWLDVLPPNVEDGTPFAKALWDIVKPSLGKGWPSDSILPELNYGNLLFTWGPIRTNIWDAHDTYGMETKERISLQLEAYCINDVSNLAEAISQGLRGSALVPALHGDLHTWMFEDPDTWPTCVQTDDGPTFRVFRLLATFETAKHSICTLPLDILLEIFPNIALIDILHTSATCKSMRNLFLREDIVTTLLRKMIHHGSLRWIKPCAEVEGEVERARKDLLSWIRIGDYHDQTKDPLLDPKFPFIRFVYTCLCKSDSMKSRKRLWGIAKQLEGKWNPEYAATTQIRMRDLVNDPRFVSDSEESDSDEDGWDEDEGQVIL